MNISASDSLNFIRSSDDLSEHTHTNLHTLMKAGIVTVSRYRNVFNRPSRI